MLENALLHLKKEVAMDGNKGTSMTDVWTYVERFLMEEVKNNTNYTNDSSTPTIIPVVDSHYKAYFWRYLRHLPDLFFAAKDQSFTTAEQQLKDIPANEDESSIDYEHGLIQGITQLDYHQAKSKYGSRLYVVANEKLQEEQLFIGIPVGQSWPANLRYYLSTILQAREAGITQAELTRLWNTDPRISGHFVKKLEEKGAITRTLVTLNGTRTNLCVHTRFKNRGHIPNISDELKSGNTNVSGVVITKRALLEQLTKLLENAKDNVIYTDDLLMALGFDLSSSKTRKWFSRTTDHLCQSGHIRKSNTRSNGTTRGRQYIQLAKSKSELESRLTRDGDNKMNYSIDKFGDMDPFVLKARNELARSSHLLNGISVEYQVLRLIKSAGNEGITHKDICAAVRCDNQRITARAIDQLYESKQNGKCTHGLERVLEFVGKNRRYRYYSHLTKHLEMQKSNTTFDHYNQSNLDEIDYRALNQKTTNYNKNVKKKNQRSLTTADNSTNIGSINRENSLVKLERKAFPDQQSTRTSPTANLSSSTTSATERASLDHRPLDDTDSTQAPIDTVFATSTSTNTKDKPIQHINKYLEMRKQIVMALLEDENIIERGIGLTKRFLVKQSELFGDNGNKAHLIDGKTIWRSVMVLDKEGKIQICERRIPLLNGKMATRHFILKKDMDTNGPLVEHYFELMAERRMLQPTMHNDGKTEMTNTQVEVLDEQLARMQNSNPSAVVEQATSPLGYKNNNINLNIGVKFGYVSCRMARAKLLHLYLLETLDSGTGMNRIERRISTAAFIYNMTLGFFCKVFGVFGYTDQFNDYVQDESHYAVTLAELPNAIRGCIFPYLDQFRARLRVLLGYLLVLGLVKKDGVMDSFSEHSLPTLASAYQLTTKANIRNYRLAGHPIQQEHSLMDLAGALMYWNNLEYQCTKTNLEDGESTIPSTNGHAHAKWIRSLYTQRNWHPSKTFSREQKTTLDKHVDLNNQSTPLNHTIWCRSIASDLNVSVKSVRGYYRKFELAMHRNSKRIHKKTSSSSPLESQRGKKSITGETVMKHKNERFGVLLTQQSIKAPDVERSWRKDSITSHRTVPLQPKRKTWTPEEDDLLKLCYVVLNSRKELGTRFIWTPLDRLFDNTSRRQCIRRLSSIREIPKHSEDIQSMRIRWRRYYSLGVAKGSLVSWEKTKGYDFDITPYMTYYLHQYRLDCANASADVCPLLPTNMQALQQYYNLKAMAALNTHSSVFFEDSCHQKHSSTAIRRLMYSHPFTQRIHTIESYDHLPTQHLSKLESSKRIIKLLQEFFKMILMTPNELYDPFYAHAVIINYPEALLEMAMEQSQEEGVLVRTDTERTADRRIPKTSLVMSEKFLQSINTRFPAHIWSSAHDYENYLLMEKKTLLDPTELHDGKMACILDLLSIGKLSINIPNLQYTVDRFGSSCYTTRNIDEKILEYTLSLELVDKPHHHSHEKQKNHKEIKRLPTNILKSIVQKYCDNSLDKEASVLVQQIVDYLYSRFDVGATLLELKQNMVMEQKLDTFSDKLFLACVDIITNQTNPPVAIFVGHDDPRLVLTSELQPWTILPRLNPNAYVENEDRQQQIPTSPIPESIMLQPTPSLLDNNDQTNGRQAKRRKLVDFGSDWKKESSQQHSKVIIPRIWMDIYGNKIDSVWRKCVDLVVEAILTRPGITLGLLRRIMMNKLTAVELKELLNALFDWGAIQQLCVSVASPSSSSSTSSISRHNKCGLFTSRHTLRTVSVSTVDPSVQTSYWLLPGYYNRLPCG